MSTTTHDVVVVGAGPAGLGGACALQAIGVEPLVIDRVDVGASFERWPAETRLLTPSFTSNFWGPIDLNAITPTTSPAYTLATEHPTGAEYARYLRAVADHRELEVRTGVKVVDVRRGGDGLLLGTTAGVVASRAVVWATGELAAPRRHPFPGAEHGVHTGDVAAYGKLDGDRFVVVGGYESGVDAAVHLVAAGRRVVVLDREQRWDEHASDPSAVLSPFSRDRLAAALETGLLELVDEAEVVAIERTAAGYTVRDAAGRRWHADAQPLLATGYRSVLGPAEGLFERDEQGRVLLGDGDGSTLTPGLHLAGPAVAHEGLVFCFIYKFRQRFAVVAAAIGDRLGVDSSPLEAYRQAGMYLDDLSCCHEACPC